MLQKLIQFINLTKHSYLYRISMHHPCRLQKLPDSRAQHMITVVEGIKLKKIDLKRKISFGYFSKLALYFIKHEPLRTLRLQLFRY